MQVLALSQLITRIQEEVQYVMGVEFPDTFMVMANLVDTKQIYQYRMLNEQKLERGKSSLFFKLAETDHYLIFQIEGYKIRIDFEHYGTTVNMNIYPIFENVDLSSRSLKVDYEVNSDYVEQQGCNEDSLDFNKQGWSNLSSKNKKKLAKFLQLLDS